MRIALFTDTFAPQVNGVSLTLKRFVHHLERNQIPHKVFVPDCPEETRFESNIHRFTSLPFFLYPECRIALPNVLEIRQQLDRFAPEIIHIATPFNMGLCGLHYSKKYNLPFVSSYHTYFDRYLSYYHLKFASRWIWSYLRWFHNSSLRTFVPSNETKEQLQNQGFKGVELWKRGVDCHLFHPAKRNAKLREKFNIQADYILLFVGRIAPEKDLDVVLDVMDILPPDLAKRCHWVFVGDGPLLEEMKEKVHSNASFTGYMSGEELAEIYASSDLFVFPSTTETFGNVVLEAAASGLPAVGARSGGVQEIIQDGETGFLSEPRNAKAMLHCIMDALSSHEKLQKLGEQARRYALSQSWDSIFDGLLNSYEEVIYENTPVRKIYSA